ncbi:MAG: ABC transporter ATP-binding protein [Gemmatimonadetes bacterium]|nr:ABC transporter ATP-binding protein [Gemmatimonadota bacterium]
MISVSNVEKSYGDRVLFSGATFLLNAGERYGLVGANGSGKTTLLNILAGDLDPSGGSVSMHKRLRLGVLRQDQFLHDEESVMRVTLMGNPELWEAMLEKEQILAAGEDGSHFDAHRFSDLEETVQRLDGYTAEARAGTILEGLGIPVEVHHKPVHTLSGGFKLRVLLAQVLASNPDVLLLDEPTNHLDILSMRWLETFLAGFPGPVVVISHDIRFLNNLVTHILDVDYGTVQLYHGDYSAFMEAKASQLERREKETAGRERDIAELQKFVDRFKAKASKARQAQSKAKQIERKEEEIVEVPASSRRWPTFRFEPHRDSGKEVLSIKGIRKAFAGEKVLDGVDLTVERGDRLAILGPNGIGKSTLLKIAMGRLEADAGEVKWGYETRPGYFAQDFRSEIETESGTVEEWIWARCPEKDRGYVRGRLGLVLFSGDDGLKRLSSLSGGEAARLVFARIALERPNVLVLDEPTNHLDLESIEALVGGLQDFAGTIILVSHDRWFVGEIATRIVEVRPDRIRDYRGTYEEYVHWCGDDHLDADRVVLKAKRESKAARQEARKGAEAGSPLRVDGNGGRNGGRNHGKTGASGGGQASSDRRKLERSRDALTEQIERVEARVAEIDTLFCLPGYFEETPPDEVRRLEGERVRLAEEAEGLIARWSALEEEMAAR